MITSRQKLPVADVIEVGTLRVVPAEYVATLGGTRLRLTHKEFKLLSCLAANAGRVVHRRRISQEVWEVMNAGRTIDIHIARLRRVLPAGAIETVVRVGYRLSVR